MHDDKSLRSRILLKSIFYKSGGLTDNGVVVPRGTGEGGGHGLDALASERPRIGGGANFSIKHVQLRLRRTLEQRCLKVSGKELAGVGSVGWRWREVEDEVVRCGERMKVTVRSGYL
jgi:hypothetical protein